MADIFDELESLVPKPSTPSGVDLGEATASPLGPIDEPLSQPKKPTESPIPSDISFDHLIPRDNSPNEEKRLNAANEQLAANTGVASIYGDVVRGGHQTKRGIQTSMYMLGLTDDVDSLANLYSTTDQIEAQYPKSKQRLRGEKELGQIPSGSEGILPTLGLAITNPGFTLSIAGESLASVVPSTAGALAGGVAGAGAGSLVVPGPGTVAGAGAGALAGMAAGSGLTDYGASFEEYLRDKFKPKDALEWKALLLNRDAINEAHWYAAKHSTAVAAFDLIGAKVGGKVAARYFVPNSTFGKKAMGTAAGTTLDALSETAGEATGQYWGKGEVDWRDAVLEGVASGPASVGHVFLESAAKGTARVFRGPEATEPATPGTQQTAYRELVGDQTPTPADTSGGPPTLPTDTVQEAASRGTSFDRMIAGEKDFVRNEWEGSYTADTDPQVLRSRLNQMLHDRDLSRKGGEDTKGKEYEVYNQEIQRLRQLLSGEGKAKQRPPGAAPDFYSTLERIVADKVPDGASAEQVLSTIQNQPGVKAEEIEQTGLNEFLGRQKGKVSKADLIAHLEERRVQVQTITQRGLDPQEVAEMDALQNEWHDIWARTKITPATGMKEKEVIRAPEDTLRMHEISARQKEILSGVGNEGKGPQWEQYVTPGPRRNYHEILLTTPENAGGERGPQGWGTTAGGTFDTENFRGAHWKYPNVIAHIRVTEREDRMGVPVAHVEELQSDWHQLGREIGYREKSGAGGTNDVLGRINAARFEAAMLLNRVAGTHTYDASWHPQRLRDTLDSLTEQYHSGTLPRGRELSAESLAEAERLAHELSILTPSYNNLQNRPPKGPFKSSWPELMLKRMLRWAADHGYERITFPSGAQALQKLGGEESFTPEQRRGLREFYDRILPSMAKKWAKKLGGNYGETSIQTGVPDKRGTWLIYDANGNVVDSTNMEGSAANRARQLAGRYELAPADTWFEPVFYIDVPARAHSRIQEGLPMYSKSARVTSAVTEAALNFAPEEMRVAAGKIGDIVQRLIKKFKFDANVTLQFVWSPSDDKGRWRITAAGHEIRVNLKSLAGIAEIYTVAMHEVGHAIQYEHFDNAPQSVQQQIRTAYSKFRTENPLSMPFRDFVAGMMNPIGYAADFEVMGTQPMSTLSPELREYWSSFDEWFAEQVARWAVTSDKPLNAVEKFFTNLGRILKEFFQSMTAETGINFRPAQAMEDWLNSFLTVQRPTLAQILEHIDQTTQQMNQAQIDKTAPEVTAAPAQAETQMTIDAITNLFGGKPPPQVAEMKAWADKFNRFYKWMVSLPQLAKRNTHIRELQLYKEDVATQHLEEQKIMDAALRVLKAWRSLDSQGDNVADLLDRMMNMSYRSEKEIKAGTKRFPTEAEFNALVAETKVNEQGLQIFRQVRKMFNDFLTINEMNSVADAMKITNPVARASALEAVKAQFDNMRKVPYFPAQRFGSHTITIRNSARKVIHFETVERSRLKSAERVQRDRAAELRKDLEPGEEIFLGVISKDAMPMVGMPPALLAAMGEKLELSKTQREALEQLKFEFAPSQSFRHRFQSKRNVEGYSMNFKRAFAHYFFHGAKFYSRVKYNEQLKGHIKAVRDQAKWMPDGIKRGEIANFMSDHFRELMDPKTDFAALRAMMFTWALGFSPAAATLNLSQMFVGTYPFLASKFGDIKAVSAMTRAGADLSSYYKRGKLGTETDFELRALSEGIKEGVITEAMAPELAAITDGRNLGQGFGGNVAQRAFNRFNEMSSFMFEMTEQMNRRITFRAALKLVAENPNAKHIDETVRLNERQYAALRAQGWTEQEARAFVVAKDAVETTQFIYARWAQPRFMRGKLRTVFVFKTFVQNTLFFLWNNKPAAARSLLIMAYLGGFMGLPGGDEIKRILRVLAYQIFGKDFDLEREARRFILDISNENIPPDLLLHGLSRRGFGIPAILDGLGVAVGREDSGVWKQRFLFGRTPNTAESGHRAPIVDRSRAISMGSILPVELDKLFGPPEKDQSRAISDQVQKASGAAFGTFFNIYKALTDSQLEAGDPKRWERAVPRAFASVSRAYRAFSEGRERNKSGSTVAKFDPRDPEQMYEILAMAGGYMPLKLSSYWDRVLAEREAVEFWHQKRNGLLKQYFATVQSGDMKEREKVRNAIVNYNDTLPKDARGQAISSDTLSRSMRMRARAQASQETGTPMQRGDVPLVRGIQRLFPESVVDVREVK